MASNHQARLRYLCAGPYPSVSDQALRLRAEAISEAVPVWPLEHYIEVVEAVNEYLLGLLVARMRERRRDLYGW
jgi:hypothetical protein